MLPLCYAATTTPTIKERFRSFMSILAPLKILGRVRAKVFGECLAKAKKEIFLASAFYAGKESTPVILFWFAFFVRQSQVAIRFSGFDFCFVAKRKERGKKILQPSCWLSQKRGSIQLSFF